MPIGNPPTKPAADASDAEHAKYRHDFDLYVAEKLAELAETELQLKTDQKTADEKLRDLDGRERGIEDQEKNLDEERNKVEARSVFVASEEENLRKEEKNYTDKMNILKMQQAEAKVEEKRLKALKRELEEKGGAGIGGLPPALTDILLQQKTLLEKQVILEQEREAREKEERQRKQRECSLEKALNHPFSEEMMERGLKHI